MLSQHHQRIRIGHHNHDRRPRDYGRRHSRDAGRPAAPRRERRARMTPPKSGGWVADAEGFKALVTSPLDWRAAGWLPCDPPGGEDMVWLDNASTGGKQRFAWPAVPSWARPRGPPGEP